MTYSTHDKANEQQQQQQQQQNKSSNQTAQFVDNRASTTAQLAMQQFMHNSPRATAQHAAINAMSASAVQQQKIIQRMEPEEELQLKAIPQTAQLAEMDEEELLQGKFETAQRAEDEELLQGKFEPAQRAEKPNNTGLPDNLKSGIENLSGMSMDHVKVHYNSDKPAQLQAHAYAHGSEIHLAPGQDQHLPHEAWHLVQQRQGRVKPTMQLAGVAINDDPSLEKEADAMGARALQRQPAADDEELSASTPAQAMAQEDRPVVQQAPDVYAWAEYLLAGGTFEGNPHSPILLQMKALLEEFGAEKISLALAAGDKASGQEDDDELGGPAKLDMKAIDAMDELLPEPLQRLAEQVYAQDDINPIHAQMLAFHLPVTKRIVQAVKDYNYNSEWISFNPENFHSWMRLATQQASIRDAQYLIHEAIEIGELLAEEEPFDPFLSEEGFKQLDGDVQSALSKRWTKGDDESDDGEGGLRLYDKSHLVALEYEYMFLALQVNKLTGLHLTYRHAAAADPDRREPAQKLTAEDGQTPLDEEPTYRAMQQQPVELDSKVRGLLRLGSGKLTLADVVRGVKSASITGVAAQLRSKDSAPAAAIVQRIVVQRVFVQVDGKDYDTKDHTVTELMETAQRLQKANGSGDLVAKQLFTAIAEGDHKPEEELDDDYEDFSKPAASSGSVDISDLLGEEDLHVEEPDTDASLLSEGEIRNINAGLPDREAKGFNSNTIGVNLMSARRESTAAAQIAALVWGIVRGHVFLDGNKRTGALMLAAMASKNDLVVATDPAPFLLKVADATSGYSQSQFVNDVSSTVLRAQ